MRLALDESKGREVSAAGVHRRGGGKQQWGQRLEGDLWLHVALTVLTMSRGEDCGG